MITEIGMYWLTRLTSLKDGIIGLGVGMMVLFGVIGCLSLMGWLLENSKYGKKWFKYSILAFMLGGLIAISNIFIPTTKEMCAIKAIPIIANNEQIQELPNKVIELANEWIDELKPKTSSTGE